MDKIIEFIKSLFPEGTDTSALSFSPLDALLLEYTSKKVPELVQNKEDILHEKQVMKEEFAAYKEAMKFVVDEGITSESYKALVLSNEELKKAASTGGSNEFLSEEQKKEEFAKGRLLAVGEFQPKIQLVTTEKDQWKAKAIENDKKYLDYRKKSEITGAIMNAGFKSDLFWMDGVMNAAQTTYTAETDSFEVKLPLDGKGTLSLNDWITWYKTQEEGKARLKAPDMRGGGGLGSSASVNQDTGSLEDMFDDMSFGG